MSLCTVLYYDLVITLLPIYEQNYRKSKNHLFTLCFRQDVDAARKYLKCIILHIYMEYTE